MRQRLLVILVSCGIVTADVSTLAWAQRSIDPASFAEASKPVADRPSNGVCFAGGGNRAFTATSGYLRALFEMDLLKDIRYVTGVSGSSWAVVAYTYRQTNTTDAEFFGESLAPESLTLDTLDAAIPSHSLLATLPELRTIAHESTSETIRMFFDELMADRNDTVSIEELIDFLRDHSMPPENVWTSAIHTLYFKRWNIDANKFFSWDGTSTAQVLARDGNEHLTLDDFYLPRGEPPFPVLTGMVNGPIDMPPFLPSAEHSFFTNFEMTPLYVGIPHARTVTYRNETANRTIYTGGFVEPFAFGGLPVSPLLDGDVGVINVTLSPTPFSLEQASGISSMALASDFVTRGHLRTTYPTAKFDLLVPRFNTFATHTTTEPNTQQSLMYGDGGLLEISGVISLLLRGVENVVVMDMTTNNTYKADTMACLFGFGSVADSFDYTQNHVFETSSYDTLYNALDARRNKNETAVVTIDVTTVDNEWWGVKGGQSVTLTWVWLHAPGDWLARLPDNTKAAVANTSDAAPFLNFPGYDTVSQFELTGAQAMLLSHMCTYVLESNEELLRAGLAITPTPSPSPTPPPRGPGLSAGTKALIVISVLLAVAFIGGFVYHHHRPKYQREQDEYILPQRRLTPEI